MAAPDNTTLEPHYYRDNFLQLCDTVEAQYGDLLCEEEAALLQRFRVLPFNAQCLYVRLISRVGPWFRESKLDYQELGDTRPAVDALLQQGMTTEAQALSTQELGKLCTRLELQQIFASSLEGHVLHNKASLLQAIDALDATAKLRAVIAVDRRRIIAPTGISQIQNLQTLFFGNRRQSLTDFVLQDLGVTHYYPYPLDREQRLFSCRPAFDEYLACAALRDQRYELHDQGELQHLPGLAQEVLATNVRFSSSENRWHRLCNDLARDMERLQEWDLALQLYARSQRHPARERRARILEKSRDWVAAADLCEAIISSPWCEAERDAAQRIRPRIQRQLDGSRQTRRRDRFDQIELTLPRGPGPVEIDTANHLQQQWQAVHYVENKLMKALFGLAFWDQIFAPIPGVFHNPFQGGPTDMYDTAFLARRQPAVNARIEELLEGDLPAMLVAAAKHYRNYQCRWVDWRYIDLPLVASAAAHIPGDHLLAIWQRMLFDPGENRRGFPDLIAFGAGMGDYCMIEVKGPGDALQDSQKRWLRYFAERDIPAQVAWVQWTDD